MAIIVMFPEGAYCETSKEVRKRNSRLYRLVILAYFIKVCGITDKKLIYDITEQPSKWFFNTGKTAAVYVVKLDIHDFPLRDTCIYVTSLDNILPTGFFSTEKEDIVSVNVIHDYTFLAGLLKNPDEARAEVLNIPSHRFITMKGNRTNDNIKRLSTPFVKGLH